MGAEGGEFEFNSWDEIPIETPISLTRLWENDGRYVDLGPGMYCSREGKDSIRRARNELWLVRHKPREDKTGAVWFYCRDHVPSREWGAGDDAFEARGREITCSDCFLVVPPGSLCDVTGKPHGS